MRKRWIAHAILAASVLGAQRADARGEGFKLEIGPETTRVSGPVRSDGTIDYQAALLEKVKAGATPENNAQPLIEKMARMWTEYAKGLPKEERERLLKEFNDSLKRPWKEGEFADVRAWLKANEKALVLAVEASRKATYCPTELVEGRVEWNFGSLRMVAWPLCARAMMRAGSGDEAGAREDVAALYRMATLVGTGQALINIMMGSSLEMLADRTKLAAIQGASDDDRRKWIADREATPVYDFPTAVDVGVRFELLSNVMLMVEERYPEGLEGVTLLKLEAKIYGLSDDVKILPGDLMQVDWNVVLRTANEFVDEEVKILRAKDLRKRGEMMRAFMAKMKKDTVGNLFDAMEEAMLHPEREDMQKRQKELVERLEDFLKRRDGETVTAFSRRIAGLFVRQGNIAGTFERIGRDETSGRLYAVAFGLEKYRLSHGEYPRRLENLVPADLTKGEIVDPYSGEAFIYRLDGAAGYALYSVGENGKDDGGKRGSGKDDIALTGR